MRFYPTEDVHFFVDIPDGWDRYCLYPHKKSWKYTDLKPTDRILYWRDIEGAVKPQIYKSDLYFKNWMRTRRREGACLPIYYGVGHRFIRLSAAPPANFLCSLFPMNLEEIRDVNAKLKAQAKLAKKLAKAAKKAAKKAKKAAKKKGKKK